MAYSFQYTESPLKCNLWGADKIKHILSKINKIKLNFKNKILYNFLKSMVSWYVSLTTDFKNMLRHNKSTGYRIQHKGYRKSLQDGYMGK